MATLNRSGPNTSATPPEGATPHEPTAGAVAPLTPFQSALEQQHEIVQGSVPALVINPQANIVALLPAAMARSQALAEGISAWMTTDNTSSSLHEILRPLDHLADELKMLLDAMSSILWNVAKEVRNG